MPSRHDLLSEVAQNLELRTDTGSAELIPQKLRAGLAYPGRILNVARRRYQISPSASTGDSTVIHLTPVDQAGMSPGVTTKAVSLNIVPTGRSEWLARSNTNSLPGGMRFTVGCDDVLVHEDVLGYHHVSWLEPQEAGVSARLGTALTAEFETRALLLSFGEESNITLSSDVLHALKHAFRSVLPLLIHVNPDEYEIAIDTRCAALNNAPTVFILDYAVGGHGLADLLELRVPELFTEAFDLLATCPCVDGCPNCLQLLDCRALDANQGLDKQGAMTLLGALLGRQESAALITRLRTTPVESIHDAEAIRRRLIEHVFPERLGLVISPGEVAPLRLFDENTTDGHPRLAQVAGLFQLQPRQVWIRKLNHERITGVIAHEYAHNWQFVDGNLSETIRELHAIKEHEFVFALLIEGFAMWVAYKALDYLGFLNEKSRIEEYLTVNLEYPEGLRFFRLLEDEYGQKGPVDLMRQGTTKYDIQDLLSKAGCTAAVLSKYQDMVPDWNILPPPRQPAGEVGDPVPRDEEAGEAKEKPAPADQGGRRDGQRVSAPECDP